MNILKVGNKGEEVKTLQKALGVTVDGTFGTKTEQAVKSFQSKHNLTADGIVGTKTWEALGIKSSSTSSYVSKCLDSSYIFKPLAAHITKLVNRPIKYLAIHFTAGSSSNPGEAKLTYNTFNARPASADFCVDDRDIVQFNPNLDNYYCWAVGDTKKTTKNGAKFYDKASNKNTISIEICSTCRPKTTTAVSNPNHEGWSFTEAALNNAVRLAKRIMKTYNIPITNVIRHYDITGKQCPGIIGWNDELIYDLTNKKLSNKTNNSNEWLNFKKRLV